MKSRIWIIFIALLCFVAAPVAAYTRKDCSKDHGDPNNQHLYGNKCYSLLENGTTSFGEAQSHCQLHGGSLAVVMSKEIDDFLVKMYGGNYTAKVWIGSRYNQSSESFEWVDGFPLSYSNFWIEDKASWDFMQYNDSIYEYYDKCYNPKGCLVFDMKHKAWRKFKCDNKHSICGVNGFLCEYELSTIANLNITLTPIITNKPLVTTATKPTTSTANISVHTRNDCPKDHGNNQCVHGNKCYSLLENGTISFEEAQSHCQLHGGSLAVVTSKDINDFLVKMYGGNYTAKVWIGSRYNQSSESFEWVDGSTYSYSNFWFEDDPFWDYKPKTDPKYKYYHNCYDPQGCLTLDMEHRAWRKCKCANKNSTCGVNGFLCEYELPPNTTPTTTTTTTTTTTVPTTRSTTANMTIAHNMNTTNIMKTTLSSATPSPATNTSTSLPTQTTTSPRTTTMSTSPETMATAKIKKCPKIICNLDCGLDGFKKDSNRCLICACDF